MPVIGPLARWSTTHLASGPQHSGPRSGRPGGQPRRDIGHGLVPANLTAPLDSENMNASYQSLVERGLSWRS